MAISMGDVVYSVLFILAVGYLAWASRHNESEFDRREIEAEEQKLESRRSR